VRGEAKREAAFKAGYSASPTFCAQTAVTGKLVSPRIPSSRIGCRNGFRRKKAFLQNEPTFFALKLFATNWQSTTCNLTGREWVLSKSVCNKPFWSKMLAQDGFFPLRSWLGEHTRPRVSRSAPPPTASFESYSIPIQALRRRARIRVPPIIHCPLSIIPLICADT
jgi:hypothetical protein